LVPKVFSIGSFDSVLVFTEKPTKVAMVLGVGGEEPGSRQAVADLPAWGRRLQPDPAMEVVTGALPSVITKLGELLVGEYNLQKG
jgi:hypothetical protein